MMIKMMLASGKFIWNKKGIFFPDLGIYIRKIERKLIHKPYGKVFTFWVDLHFFFVIIAFRGKYNVYRIRKIMYLNHLEWAFSLCSIFFIFFALNEMQMTVKQ